MARSVTLVGALLLVALAIAACGGGSDPSSTSSSGSGGGGAATQPAGGGTTITLTETAQEGGGLSFSKSHLTARAGTVTIKLTNPSGNQLPHAIEIEGNGVEEETDTVSPGGSGSVTVKLRPGRYEFYCPVDGHRAQGMEGTLTVQ